MGFIKTLLGSQSPLQKSLLHGNSSVSIGVIHNDKPVINNSIFVPCTEDSIIDSVDTGFGNTNTLHLDCPKPKYKTHLFKENYLSEFKNFTEKALVRNNLEVYSKAETDLIISHIIIDKGLISKDDISEIMKDLDFVDSTHQSDALYDIPDKLFKL